MLGGIDTLPTLFTTNTQIILGFTFRTHFLGKYEFRCMLKKQSRR